MPQPPFGYGSHQSGSDIRLQALACFLFIELFIRCLVADRSTSIERKQYYISKQPQALKMLGVVGVFEIV